MITVGINGLIGSGKDTIADILEEDRTLHVVRSSFANVLKDSVSTMTSLPMSLLEGRTQNDRQMREIRNSRFNMTPREILQKVGVAMREIDPDFWINALDARTLMLPAHQLRNSVRVITDVRFPNEAESVLRSEGFIVNVSRGEEPKWARDILEAGISCYTTDLEYVNQVVENLPHESEWRSRCFDFPKGMMIYNDGTIDDLREKVKHRVIEEIKDRQMSQL